MPMDHAVYDAHFDAYGQPNTPGWGPFLSVYQREALLARLSAGATLTPTERYIITSGQLGIEAAEALGGTDDAQSIPGMTIETTLPAFGVALLAYFFLRR